MKKILFSAIAIISLLASCSRDNFEDNTTPTTPGGEVDFSFTVASNATRTIYGDRTGNQYPVYWVHEDGVTVFGSNCSRQQADYVVSTQKTDTNNNLIYTDANGNETTNSKDSENKDNTPVINDNQNYATSLTKKGDYGVQWGEAKTSNFYSVYPAVEDSFELITYVDEETEETIEIAQVLTTINPEQKVIFAQDGTNSAGGKKFVGTPYENLESPSMPNALMYAATYDVPKGEKVDLNYKPYSTVLMLTITGPILHNDTQLGGDTKTSMNIETITVTAPDGNVICGDLMLEMSKAWGVGQEILGGGNAITIHPQALTLATNDTAEFPIFIIPQDDLAMTYKDPWSVSVKDAVSGVTYKYEVKPKLPAGAEDASVSLVAGKIHHLTIPQIQLTQKMDINPAVWMTYIPRNVYLSELSVPGAWYATNSDYQGDATLTTMYNNGVRAFNIDCRMTASADSWEKKSFILTYYELKSNPTYLLQCAGSETLTGQKVGGIERVSSVGDGKTVESQLELLSTLVQPEEFIYVILTISEKPKDLTGALSDSSETFGNNCDPENIVAALKDILKRKGKAMNVFGYRDKDADKTLNANTTLNDVLGSMVIKLNINVDQDATELANYGMSNILISEGSMVSQSKYTAEGANGYPNVVMGSFTKMNSAKMYWGSSVTDPEMDYYYHQAQLTTSSTSATSGSTTPSLYDRQVAVKDIIDQSATIYKQNKHNALFQLGIGGYIDNSGEDRATVARTLNKYVKDQIEAKLTTMPTPLGIVLMNHCTSAETSTTSGNGNGAGLVTSILEYNKAFRLNRDQSQLEWPNGYIPNPDAGVEAPN